MAVRVLADPIGDPRWAALLDRHPQASVFHAPGWLDALRRTYGFEPFVVTTSPAQELQNGLVLCQVRGLRSPRLVSLPFSDHCDPLVNDPGELSELLGHTKDQLRTRRLGSVEIRPRGLTTAWLERTEVQHGLRPSQSYVLHQLDLRQSPDQLLASMHHSSTRRGIRRAAREHLTYECGRSEAMLADFFRLFRMTRRRHGLPPQPLEWFRNLRSCLGDALTIHLARLASQPIAAIVTVSFKGTMVYKYGGSDAAHHRRGTMPFLFWNVIQTAHTQGLATLDLGRSDLDQPGLVTFKDHLGATSSPLSYYSFPPRRADTHQRKNWASRLARVACEHLPDSALDLLGRIAYKHAG